MSAFCHFSGLTLHFGADTLFSNLSGTLTRAATTTGLIGPNGRGKSVLLKLLAGRMTPSAGKISWDVPIFSVDQVTRLSGPRLADALAVALEHDRLCRIEQGQGSLQDLEQAADQWHLPASWKALLTEAGLPQDLDAPISRLSGGEQTRLALCAAFMKRDHFLLLDEPSNHLDAQGRSWLMQCLAAHPGGALVASHDRTLLRQCSELLELTGEELRRYGGNYDLYRSVRQAETDALEQQIEHQTRQLHRDVQQHLFARQSADTRRRQGERQRASGSQGKMLLDARAQRAQHTEGCQQSLHQQRQRQMQEELGQLKARRELLTAQRLELPIQGVRGGVRLHLDALQLPWVKQAPLSLTVYGGERWRVQGANGSGKSTLLRIIAGQIEAPAGECRVSGRCLYLDQECSFLQPDLSAVDNLQRLNPHLSEAELRTQLGRVRLRRDKALLPTALLSGGERMKVALLAISGLNQAPDLLLLDEPDNHLDLDSRELLESVLRDYPGMLMVVSHDELFIEAVGVGQYLQL
ncbi:ATP-binding cassette domain-containing protein [Nitrincola alkalilacustris]|uniref:ATP-binding cassette domain-containing protein n=1 Tax=Nitrincola alkalilacustris TaxID=1571224 RepID=UPI00124C7205|nr:ATP-binding cassette domain-containing protein [Nitrincola alkalilacustris]